MAQPNEVYIKSEFNVATFQISMHRIAAQASQLALNHRTWRHIGDTVYH